MNPETTPASPTLASSAEAPTAAKPASRPRSVMSRTIGLQLSQHAELINSASKTEYSTLLAAEGLDAAFMTAYKTKLADAQTLYNTVRVKRADRQGVTVKESEARDVLVDLVRAVQNRAKRKYGPGDPLRLRFCIGDNIETSRPVLENAAQGILKTLALDPLPGVKPTDITQLQTALNTYLNLQTNQLGDQADAQTARGQLEAKLQELAKHRREIQYSAEALWPASKPANAGIRVEFQLRSSRAKN